MHQGSPETVPDTGPPCNFIFDVVITHFKTNKIQIKDPKKLEVHVSFNKLPVQITESRINVTDFNTGFGRQFKVTARRLRNTVSQCGMPVTVIYNKNVIGTGMISFPQSFIDRISAGMSDLMHADSCLFEQQGQVVGTLEILCRLCVKCEEKTEKEERECHRSMDTSINPQDIMFVLGENQQCPNPCDPCPDTLEPEEDDERIQLDLQRYRSSNAVRHRPAEHLIHNPTANVATCVLKKMSRECDRVVDSIFKRTGQPKSLKQPCRTAEDLNSREIDHTVKSIPSAPTFPCFSYFPQYRSKENEFCSPQLIPVPISDLKKPEIKPIRFCPVCLTNMSWLPKFATCPNCGVKPMPVVEERHKDKKLTADQILTDYLGKPIATIGETCVTPCAKSANRETSEDQTSGCRCTCQSKKICAHCRIRQLCADIFQCDENAVVCPETKPQSSDDFCVVENNLEECRPHLARVFSELRDLYNIKETKLTADLDTLCNRNSAHKNKQRISNEVPTVKTGIKPAANRGKAIKKNTAEKALKTIADTRRPIAPRHMSCFNQHGEVSRRHGWAWTSSKETRMHGWRPGFIRKPIKKLMKFFLQYLPESTTFNNCVKAKEEVKQNERQDPILNVCKKNGEIIITLRAVNNPKADMKPIKFKIVKSDLAVTLREIKRLLKNKGFRKCTCHSSVMMCVCRNVCEKKHLESALEKECKRRGIENCVNHLVLTDTSDSEMEFEFDVTPPAGTAKPPSRLKPRTVNHATQSTKADQSDLSKYPIKHSPYWRAYDCAAGDRYTGAAFGAPGEDVFEDGLFGYRGGGPHGTCATPSGMPKNAAIWGASCGGPMRGGGRFGPEGSPGGKSFLGAKHKPDGKGGRSQPIPVRMPQRFLRMAEMAAKAKQDAIDSEMAKRKLGINMMKYLRKHGAFSKKKPEVGPDGLTDAQRRRRALFQIPPPPIEFMPRLGKGFDPCAAQCYNQCSRGWDNRCSYYC